MTLLKYFLNRWTLPTLGALLFFGGLLVANDLVFLSREIFSQGAHFRWMAPLILTTLPETFAMVLPMAATLGGLLGTQHLSEASEMVASQGLGVGMRAILKPWLLLASGLIVIATVNAHWMVPKVCAVQDRFKTEMIEETKTRWLRPGAPPFFPQSAPGDAVWIAPNGEIHLIEVSPTGVQHLIAKELNWVYSGKDVDKPALILNFKDLKGCHLQKVNNSVGLLQQESQNLRIDLPSTPRILPPTPVRYLPTMSLLRERTLGGWIELSRRFTLPFSSAALLLVGIALGLGHPRFHRGGALIKSLGVILLYYLVMKYFENQVLNGNLKSIFWLFLLPLAFFTAGISLLAGKLRPHHSNRFQFFERPITQAKRWITLKWIRLGRRFQKGPRVVKASSGGDQGILGSWTRRLWWRNWGAAMGTFLTLDLLMEFAQLAADLSKNHVSYLVFLQYWVCNLPPFLAVVFPVAFLLGGVLAFTDAAISREWVALRAGGASLLQWMGSGARAWVSVLVATFLVQAFVAPAFIGRADGLYRKILDRPVKVYQSKPWMNLGSNGVLWFLDEGVRWGFPLKSPGDAPILLRWKLHDTHTEALPWGGLHLVPGPDPARLFPDKALRNSASAEESSTLDLFEWQRWAPDPERATMLWGRLLNWMAGPCLLFAMLVYAFPAPRGGRGQALGFSLVAGLLFLGMQALFGGAARAGEIPAFWGVAAPLLLLSSFGLIKLNRLRT